MNDTSIGRSLSADLLEIFELMDAEKAHKSLGDVVESVDSAQPARVLVFAEHSRTAALGLSLVYGPLVDDIEPPAMWSVGPLGSPEPAIGVTATWPSSADSGIDVVSDVAAGWSIDEETHEALAGVVVLVRADNAGSATEVAAFEQGRSLGLPCAIAVIGMDKLEADDRAGVHRRLEQWTSGPTGSAPAAQIIELADPDSNGEKFAAFAEGAISYARSEAGRDVRRCLAAARAIEEAAGLLGERSATQETEQAAAAHTAHRLTHSVLSELRRRKSNTSEAVRSTADHRRQAALATLQEQIGSAADLADWWGGSAATAVEREIGITEELVAAEVESLITSDVAWLESEYEIKAKPSSAVAVRAAGEPHQPRWSKPPRSTQAAIGGVLVAAGLVTGTVLPLAATAAIAAFGLEVRYRSEATNDREHAVGALRDAYSKGMSEVIDERLRWVDGVYRSLRDQTQEYAAALHERADDLTVQGVRDLRQRLESLDAQIFEVIHNMTGVEAR